MPYTFYSGKDAWVKVAGVRFPMKKWGLKISVSRVDVTNMESLEDFREFLTGFKDCEISLEGLFDPTIGLIAPGLPLSFELGIGGSYKFAIDVAMVMDVEFGQDIEGSATIKIVAKPSGVFTILLV